ncbi:MAG: response regulator [Roseiarcus sp.]
MRILLVEDDRMIGEGLCEALRREAFVVDWVRDGVSAEEALAVGGHALALLDIGLPGRSGIDVLKAARRAGQTLPVLIITARDGVDDRVEGLDLGADDYVVKPFATRELVARIRAVLRRRAGAAQSTLAAGGLVLDLASHELNYGGVCSVLPAREFALVHNLMERPGTILSRAQIEERIYGWGEEVLSNAVDALIHSIRKKFDRNVIRNVRGAGWMIPKAPS